VEAERISVLIPVFNESDYLDTLIDSLAKQSFPREATELIFIDGGSTDDTVQRLEKLRDSYVAEIESGLPAIDHFRILDNPNRTVSYALNIGVAGASHGIILRLDAHCEYAGDYFEKVVETLTESGADIVGGPTRVASRSTFQGAVGQAICSRFAVGGSRVHQLDYRGDTDSVTFGSWRREVFEKTGSFDVRLVRNQDDEFHYRATSLGLRIYQEPDIKLYYYPRETPTGLFKQYFQYGKYKPLVLRKVKSAIRLRHLAPSAFVLYLLALPLAVMFPVLLGPALLYLTALAVSSLVIGRDFKERICLFVVYPLIHLGYGLGFLVGLPLTFEAEATLSC
jgi:glycosyltransferase involved in cell wall biosynthesis